MYNLEKFNFYLNELINNLETKMLLDTGFRNFVKFYNFKYYTDKYFFINIFNENINDYLINLINREDIDFFNTNFENIFLKNILLKIKEFWISFSLNEKKYIWNYFKILNYYSK